MTSPLRIRTFEPPDESAVVQLWRDCGLVVPWNDPHRDIARKLAFQPGLFLVAMWEGRLVATAMAGYDGHRGVVNYVAVAPDARQQGIGRQIMEEAENRLRALGCPKLVLQVRTNNQAVMGFYRSLGYLPDDIIQMGKRFVNDEDTSGRG